MTYSSRLAVLAFMLQEPSLSPLAGILPASVCNYQFANRKTQLYSNDLKGKHYKLENFVNNLKL